MNGDKASSTYRNPFWPGCFADPFVLKVRGRYYAYATEGEDSPPDGASVFPILTSGDLVHWDDVGKALPALGQPYFRYWAPEVTVDNGRFLLYYAVHTAEFIAAIRVATAERPEGPFVDSGHDLTSALFPWAIDPHPFRDAAGRWYLYMTVEMWDDPAGLIGVGNVVDRLVDPFTLSGHPTRVTPPRHAWELFEAQRPEKGGVDWYCVEGPAVLRHRGRYYELFSGGCYYRDNYAVSYATSNTPMGPGGMRDDSWHDWEPDGQPGWLMHGDPAHAIGPGHNSLVHSPNNADLYIAYHAWPADMAERRPCLDRLYWHGDRPWTPAPTIEAQPAPALPRMRALCDPAQSTLGDGWHDDGGAWQVAGGALTQVAREAARALLQCPALLGGAWLLEVNLCHIDGAGRYGLALGTAAGGHTSVAIEQGIGLAVWSSQDQPSRAAFPTGFEARAWHQVLLAYAGSVLAVALDGLPLLEVVAADLSGPFSLLTERCSAAFSGISLTDHFRDEFLDAGRTLVQLGWRAAHASNSGAGLAVPTCWQAGDGRLEQTDASPGERLLYKGMPHEHYEYGATMRLVHPAESGAAALGLVAWQRDEGSVLVLLARRGDGWDLVVEGRGVARDASATRSLPATFDPHDWHTLRVVRRGESLTVCLDGPEALAIAVPPGPGVVGLVTRAAAAAFSGVWQTGHTA